MPTPCPDEVGPPFTAPCDDIPVEWVEVTSIHDDLVPTGSPELQFRLFANRFKSSSPDCEYFLHDPLRHMLLKPGALKGLDWWPDESSIVDPDDRDEAIRVLLNDDDPTGRGLRDEPMFHITTFVSNHHRKLTRVHLAVMAIAAKDGIHLITYKDTNQD